MRIERIRTVGFQQPPVPIHARRFAGPQEIVLVIVETDDGHVGHSMARAHGGQSGRGLAEAIVRTLAPRLIGLHPLHREAAWQSMVAMEPAGYVQSFPVSAIDVALWDLAGQLLQVPLYRLLGGRRERILAYASSANMAHVDDYVAEALRCVARGYRAYKIHPFDVAARDIELCRAVRDAVGPGIALMLDVAKAYDRSDAMRVGRAIQDLGFAWYEEPLPQHDIPGHVDLCRALDIPVVGAETLPGHSRAIANHLQAGALDMVLCDVYWKAGVTGMLKTAALAEAMGARVASHHGASPLMNLANLHVLCGATDADWIEILVPEDGYDYALASYLAPDADGYVHAPRGPGLGVAIDRAYIEAHKTFEL